MLKTHMAACLVTTALVIAPALAQTTTTAPASNPPASTMATTNVNAAEFVNKAANSDMFEVQSSQLALNKTQDNRVREFAQHMIQDHTQASEKLKAAAQGMTVPTSLDQEHAQMLQQLQQASGNDFTRSYVQMQFMGHQRAVALFDSYAQNGDNAQLKQFAQQTAPTLRTHLQQITQIRNDVLGSTGQGREGTQITVQQPAPAVRVEQAAPQVTVQQPQPNVTVRQPNPEILVRQPAPTVTVNIPQPEIIVRMPQPEVNVAQAQPQVNVRQAQPNVQVVQPQQPQVQVTPAQPQVAVQQQSGAQPNVQIQQAEGQPQIRYERAEPQITVNQAQGQPNVRVERADGQPAQGAQTQQPTTTQTQTAATATQPAATGTVAAGTGAARQFSVRELEDMNVYNARDNQLGEVEDVLIGPNNQTYLVVGFGGFLGLGERRVVLPLDRFQLQNDRLIVQGMTEDQLKALPAYTRGAQGYRAAETDFRTAVSPYRQ